MQKDASPGTLMYRTQENALAPVRTADAAASVMDAETSKAWNSWIDGRLATERAEVIDQITRLVGEFASGYVHEKLQPLRRELAEVRAENLEVKRALGETLSRFAAVEAEAKALVRQIDAEGRQHDAERHAFELQVAELKGRMSGILRDYTT